MLKVGERVAARCSIDYSTACIQVGERGTVVEAGDEPPLLEYGVSVHWDAHHAGLIWWGNCTLLVGDDILALSRARKRPSIRVILQHPALLVGICLLILFCEVADKIGVF